MIQETETAIDDPWALLKPQQECASCGRSIISRFGGTVAEECDSCAADFDLLHRAGKIREDGWSLVVVKMDEP